MARYLRRFRTESGPGLAIVGIVILAMVNVACGSLAEKATEQVLEKAIESGGDGNVELDLDAEGGSFSVQTDEGSMNFGSGLDLPDTLEIPVPNDGNVTSTQSGDGYVHATITYPRERFDEVVAFYENWVGAQAGDFQTANSQYSNDGEIFRTSTWSESESGTTVGVSDCYSIDGDGLATCLTVLHN